MNGNNPMTLEDAREIVSIHDALERLESNPDFQKVFTNHLFFNEVIRLHGLLAHPDEKMVEQRERVNEDLRALSNIKFSLQMIKRVGYSTKEQLEEYNAQQSASDAVGEE